jgi:DUF1707 SHOCT-like domain
MGGTTGDGEPDAGIRASDAERDATIERLSAATGDGRLTLQEFSQRMERATPARPGPNSAPSLQIFPRTSARPGPPWPSVPPPGPPGISRRSAA